jgi:hypothetical protein
MVLKTKEKWEYGDFQTPIELAKQALSVLKKLGIHPQAVLEPTCGEGAFLLTAADTFASVQKLIGFDINVKYLNNLKRKVAEIDQKKRIQVLLGDFFTFDWHELLSMLPEPILIVGNPPWVTSAELGLLQSKNLPQKSNFQIRRGYDAITGKSNFDISEWMLLKHLEWLKQRRGIIAMLCKTSVARKILSHVWKSDLPISLAHMYLIDAQKYFGASVDACFFVIIQHEEVISRDCLIYNSLADERSSYSIGFRDNLMLSNVEKYERLRHLKGVDYSYTWRSGIKHDCSKVMELERNAESYKNGFGELVKIENDYIYPMLKSSDIGNGNIRFGRKYMLVTQRFVCEDTISIKRTAPLTWRYLEKHDEKLSKRASSIYRNRPRFSIFGVGGYSFSQWKVAISGFYKRLSFKVVGPFEEKPVVLDDTVYFLPCWSEAEANFIALLLNSQPAIDFLDSMIFWSDKRPITIDILKKLNLHALSKELDKEDVYLGFARQRRDRECEEIKGQLSLGIAENLLNIKIKECKTNETSAQGNKRAAF